MRKRTGRRRSEWVGGIAQLRRYVMDEGEPYRPEVLLWVRPDDLATVGEDMEPPGVLIERAAEHLASTMKHPILLGTPKPARVRVASEELAARLRAGHPTLEVVCAPTPELDAAVRALEADLAHLAAPTYLVPGIDAKGVASFFRAAADCYRSAPWRGLLCEPLFAVTVESHGLRGAPLTVFGQGGGRAGFLLFSTVEDFDAHLPPYLSIAFEHGTYLWPEPRREISRHRWEVAGPVAYPWVVFFDESDVVRPPTASEIDLAEALLVALPEALRDPLFAAAASGEPAPEIRTIVARTHAGDVPVTLRSPHEEMEWPLAASSLAGLAALDRGEAVRDRKDRTYHEDWLLCRFWSSPEGKAMQTREEWMGLVWDCAARKLGPTFATLDAPALRTLVFELLPAENALEPEGATRLVAQLRAIYAWAGRELGLAQAEACLRVLGGDAVERLEEAVRAAEARAARER